ncbi:MAG: RHS repeat-associated core domain-containing protein [Planctomycetia bacterium]|nr:RHS repeat-associated core domain-containing protein [Planctomycetia bacterium]
MSIDGSDVSVRCDAAGNMARIPNFNLVYDAWNRLVRVTDLDGTQIAEYRYDGLNRRVLKITQSETREYYYNKNWQCMEEYSNGTLQNSYIWGIRYLDNLICFTPNYTVALTDANFNVVAVANQSGLTERYAYTAFGNRIVLAPDYTLRTTTHYPTLTRTLTSQVLDSETGIMLYRNRYYSANLGRFITRDPIGYESLDRNVYRYVMNSPFVFIDCFGLQFNGIERIVGSPNDVTGAIGRAMAEQGQIIKPTPPMAPKHNCTKLACEIECEKYPRYITDWRIVHTGVVLDYEMTRDECLERCRISERLFNEWYTKNLRSFMDNTLASLPM